MICDGFFEIRCAKASVLLMALVTHSESMTPAQVMAKDMTHAELVTASKPLFTTLTANKVG